MSDTSPEIAAMVRRMMLARPPEDRLLMGSRMFDAARFMVLASLPGGLSELEVKIRLCERFYGTEVNLAAFSRRLSHPSL